MSTHRPTCTVGFAGVLRAYSPCRTASTHGRVCNASRPLPARCSATAPRRPRLCIVAVYGSTEAEPIAHVRCTAARFPGGPGAHHGHWRRLAGWPTGAGDRLADRRKAGPAAAADDPHTVRCDHPQPEARFRATSPRTSSRVTSMAKATPKPSSASATASGTGPAMPDISVGMAASGSGAAPSAHPRRPRRALPLRRRMRSDLEWHSPCPPRRPLGMVRPASFLAVQFEPPSASASSADLATNLESLHTISPERLDQILVLPLVRRSQAQCQPRRRIVNTRLRHRHDPPRPRVGRGVFGAGQTPCVGLMTSHLDARAQERVCEWLRHRHGSAAQSGVRPVAPAAGSPVFAPVSIHPFAPRTSPLLFLSPLTGTRVPRTSASPGVLAWPPI